MILLDSSAWIEYLRATRSPTHRYVRHLLEQGRPIATTGVVMLEVLAGAHDESHARKLSRLQAGCSLLAAEEPSDHEAAAALYRACRREGTTVRRPPDLLIATIAIRTDTPLLHADADFDAIARHASLRVLDPLTGVERSSQSA